MGYGYGASYGSANVCSGWIYVKNFFRGAENGRVSLGRAMFIFYFLK